MAKAVASGMPKLKIEESAAKRQARIDGGQGKRITQPCSIRNLFDLHRLDYYKIQNDKF